MASREAERCLLCLLQEPPTAAAGALEAVGGGIKSYPEYLKIFKL